MATLLPTLQYSASSSWVPDKKLLYSTSCFPSSLSKAHLSFALISKPNSKRLNFYVKAEKGSESSGSSSSSPVAVVSEESKNEDAQTTDSHVRGELGNGAVSESEKNEAEPKSALDSDEERTEKEKMQELDWKTDEDFKKFMGNPSIEAAIKLEKKRTDRRLKELNRETSDNPIVGLFNKLVRDNLSREKERLEKAEEAFKALDLNKVLQGSSGVLVLSRMPSDSHAMFFFIELHSSVFSSILFNYCLKSTNIYDSCACSIGFWQLKSCFGFDTFFATDVRRFGDGGIFVGNLRKPIEEAIPKLERKLSEAAGTEVVVWFMEEKTNDITKQVTIDELICL